MHLKIKVFCMFLLYLNIISHKVVEGSVAGLTYRDPIRPRQNNDNPCNQLYWYPRPIPEYCHYKPLGPSFYSPIIHVKPTTTPDVSTLPPKPPEPAPTSPQLPIPIPYPLPPPVPIPMPMPVPVPFVVPAPTPLEYSVLNPIGIPQERAMTAMNDIRVPSLPIEWPTLPMMPQIPYYQQYHPQEFYRYVPMVSPGVGINVLPFTDTYSDVYYGVKKLFSKNISS